MSTIFGGRTSGFCNKSSIDIVLCLNGSARCLLDELKKKSAHMKTTNIKKSETRHDKNIGEWQNHKSKRRLSW